MLSPPTSNLAILLQLEYQPSFRDIFSFQDMLRATGAIVVQSLSALAAEKSRLRIIMIQADMYEYEIISKLFFKLLIIIIKRG